MCDAEVSGTGSNSKNEDYRTKEGRLTHRVWKRFEPMAAYDRPEMKNVLIPIESGKRFERRPDVSGSGWRS